MMAHARSVGRGDQTHLLRQLERQHHACGHGLAMQQAAVVPELRLECVGKGVPEI